MFRLVVRALRSVLCSVLEACQDVSLRNLLHSRILFERSRLEVLAIVMLQRIRICEEPRFHQLNHPKNRVEIGSLWNLQIVGDWPLTVLEQDIPSQLMLLQRDQKILDRCSSACDELKPHTLSLSAVL